MNTRASVVVAAVVLAGCGGHTNGFGDAHDGAPADVFMQPDYGIITPDSDIGYTTDGATDIVNLADADVINVYDGTVITDACATDTACVPMSANCGPTEVCNNGLDDNCDGMVDENCPCIPGTVQDCFLGPPNFRNVGACQDGTQRCEGSGEFGNWGACQGGISPGDEVCDHLDNNCNGCVDEIGCCDAQISCPGPGDPRIPDGQPFSDYHLHGTDFFPGTATAWHWTVVGGPCDTLLPHPTYTFSGANTATPVLHPTLSGDYTVTMTVTAADGMTFTCTFVIHIAGPGLRVELCWDTSTTVDLDLYLHDPRNTDPWFDSSAGPLSSVNLNSCNWSDCEAIIRGSNGRVNWGLANSALTACQNGPHGADWTSLGYCANPRLDIDNNLSKASGLPENINVDNPMDRQRFRVMVQNFSGTLAHPMINVYCGGHLRGTIGAAPDTVPGFSGDSGYSSCGAMWRAADVVVHVDATGATTDCDVTPLHPAGSTTGYFVTEADPSY